MPKYIPRMGWYCFCTFILSPLFTENAISLPDTTIHAPSVCSFRNTCKPSGSAFQPCVYNGKPQKFDNDAYNDLLRETCPDLMTSDNPDVCCAYEQLQAIEKNLQFPQQLLSRCEPCLKNFVKLWCFYTCSPNQSQFVNVTDAHPYVKAGHSEQSASAMTYYLDEAYVYGMYQSCEQVQFPSGNQQALGMMCGTSDCSPQKLVTYLGSTRNGYAPSDIAMKIINRTSPLPKGIVPMNASTFDCSQPISNTSAACSCVDCAASCPAPLPPTPHKPPWRILGVRGYFVVVGAAYSVFLVLFLALMYYANARKSRPVDAYKTNDGDANGNLIISAPRNLVATSSHNINQEPLRWNSTRCCGTVAGKPGLLERVFAGWAVFVTRNHAFVLLIWFLCAAAFSNGIGFLDITTDPVALWSSPSSATYKQLQYYNSHFMPFYRVEQVFVYTYDKTPDIYHNPQSGANTVFGPVFKKNILQEVFKLQHDLMSITAMHPETNETIALGDICFKPLQPNNNHCAINSPLEWFQNSLENLEKVVPDPTMPDILPPIADYHSHLIKCVQGSTLTDDGTGLGLSCLAEWGGPISPWVVLGDFNGSNYVNASVFVLTFPVNMHTEEELNTPARAWEAEFLSYLQNYTSDDIYLAFQAQRSLQDEIHRESDADVYTVAVSYFLMFIYICISLGKFAESPLEWLKSSKISLGLAGVTIVLLSVTSSVGFFGYVGVSGTLIILEVVPFLVLAVGTDNMFLLVQAYQRACRKQTEGTVDERLARVFANVAPSMLLSSVAEATAFFLGALTPMPAVQSFSLFAGMSIVFLFLFQVTCFLALLSLDARREHAGRCDVLFCLKPGNGDMSRSDYRPIPPEPNPTPASDNGLIYWLMKTFYVPFIMNNYVRPLVVALFVGWLALCGCLIPRVDVGLDQKVSMPTGSYMLDYFHALANDLQVGPPVYFVVEEGLDYSAREQQNEICGSAGCNSDSLIGQLHEASLRPGDTRIAQTASSWLDDYFVWLSPAGSPPCCRTYPQEPEHFCNATVPNKECQTCRKQTERPQGKEFYRFLEWYLTDNPNANCSKGGHAAYYYAVDYNSTGTHPHVGASYFMTYHTVLRSSHDFVAALRGARAIAANITRTLGGNTRVFPYSSVPVKGF